MNSLDIFGLICFIGITKGLVQSGYFFGEIREYMFLSMLLILVIYKYREKYQN